jgi:hypothetical protein
MPACAWFIPVQRSLDGFSANDYKLLFGLVFIFHRGLIDLA